MSPGHANGSHGGISDKLSCKFHVLSQDDENLKEIIGYLSESRASIRKEKVCVVSVIGKSNCEVNSCKAALVDEALKRNIFRGSFCEEKTVFETTGCQIEGYYDTRNNVIFLHLNSIFDSAILEKNLKKIEKEIEEKGFLQVWPDLQLNVCKAILLLFHISNIVLIVQPTPYLDLNYVSFFRVIDAARQKLQPIISDMLDSFPNLPTDWQQAGRPCSPRVLFVFESYGEEKIINKQNKNDCERNMEEQIFRMLRKARVITNNAGNSLFAISNHNDFVYISTKDPTIRNASNYLLDRLIKYCNVDEMQANEDEDDDESHSFYSFLWTHITTAFTKGFDDNIGRQMAPPIFELPTVKEFFEVVIKLKEIFFNENESDSDLKSVFNNLRSSLDIDTRFSESRCAKMLPMAMSLYQDNLPSHYTKENHERKLAQALQNFTVHARGPALYDYAQKLKEECDNYWKNGHQMCEVLSLTGNHCVNPIHRVRQDDTDTSDVSDEDFTEPGQLPSLKHCSGVKIISACDCARKQGNREDPFSVKAANYEFYLMMRNKCPHCVHLERIEFGVFQANSETDATFHDPHERDEREANASTTNIKSQASVQSKSDSQLFVNSLLEEELFESQPEAVSSFTNLSQQVNTDVNTDQFIESSKGSKEDDLDKNKEIDVSNEEVESDVQAHANSKETYESDEEIDESNEDEDVKGDADKIELIIRESESPLKVTHETSKTEYLAGMLHSLSPPGLLPKFSSWSLVCLGPSSIYSHNIGLQETGWINGSNFLMPWDVTVKLEHSGHFPQLWEGKRPPGIKNKKTFKDGTQFTVKIFLGLEYECIRGHRFIMSGPDSVLKASMGIVRETANRMASNDMPLYFPCVQRSAKPCLHLAQLMRVHLVTPKAPVQVTINPRVQPAPLPCPTFFPANSEPIKLTQSTYWILRLPFIYEGNDGPFLPPKEQLPIESCRFLKGCFGIADFIAKPKESN